MSLLCFLFMNGIYGLVLFNMEYNNNGLSMTGYVPEMNSMDTYPLFIWVTGTDMRHWTNDDQIIANYMGNKNYVSVSLDYPNALYPVLCSGIGNTNWLGKARLLFDKSNPQSALSRLCNPNTNEYTAKIDCNKGIVLSGFSQGAQLVSLSGNFGFDSEIKGIL